MSKAYTSFQLMLILMFGNSLFAQSGLNEEEISTLRQCKIQYGIDCEEKCCSGISKNFERISQNFAEAKAMEKRSKERILTSTPESRSSFTRFRKDTQNIFNYIKRANEQCQSICQE